ncbi:MAG: bifunctional folylpolyglutamate synthase/dihydrofolate synthase [Acidimicrobiia bacterium]
MNITTHDQAEAFLDERIGQGVKPGLDRITGLLAYMGDPEKSYPTIHIAGTNGKTTVSRMVQQILGAHGLATGGFTSPHLESIEERFAVHGVKLDPRDFIDAVADIAWFVEGYEESSGTVVTYFEVTAALAYSIFATAAVDVGVVEVGLGGRLDATNTLDAAVSVLTGIDIDHTEFLGTTIEEIANEKAAILKEEGTLVSGMLPEAAVAAVSARVEQTGSRWMRMGADFDVTSAELSVGGWQCTIEGIFGEYHDLFLPLHGRHQVDNLATAIATCEMFMGRALDPEALLVAVASMQSPGRLEVVGRRPIVLIDGAHNEQGFKGLAATLDGEFPSMGWQLVIGIRGERSLGPLLVPLIGTVANVFATAAEDAEAVSQEEIAATAGEILGVPSIAAGTPAEALAMAREHAGGDGGVVVAGSLYVAGEVRSLFGLATDRSAEAHVRYEAERHDEEEDGDFPEEQYLDIE